jgi:hypothetical protein
MSINLADNSTWKAVKPFLNGGVSGMGATCVIQPLDIIKARLFVKSVVVAQKARCCE